MYYYSPQEMAPENELTSFYFRMQHAGLFPDIKKACGGDSKLPIIYIRHVAQPLRTVAYMMYVPTYVCTQKHIIYMRT